MFNQIQKTLDKLIEVDLPKINFKIDHRSKVEALKLFFRLIKKYDPETCFINQKDILELRKTLLRRHQRNVIIRYLLKLISYVYATPYDNHIVDSKYDYHKHMKNFKDFHK